MTTTIGEFEMSSHRINEEEIVTFRDSLQSIAKKLERIETEHETHLRATKGRFNLFTVLRPRVDDETGLHSRFLTHLLNPNAEHDCGSLFLQLFRKRLQFGVRQHVETDELDKVDYLKTFSCDNAEVKSEAPANLKEFKEFDRDGKIDILIKCREWGSIAIENKTRLGEQPDQIIRYATWLEHNSHPNHLLLFLTPHGTPSSTAGKSTHKYRRISYRDHILPWIEDCLHQTYQHTNINQALQQYKMWHIILSTEITQRNLNTCQISLKP